jgi:hypothetical protein
VYTQENPTVPAALLTHDTNPMLTAKQLNLAFQVIPEDWLLPAERDERDKRISELERRLTQYEHLAPVIAVSVTDGNGDPISKVQLVVREYPNLSSEQIEKLLALARQRYPMITDFGAKAHLRPPIALGTLASSAMFAEYGGYEWTYQAPSKEEIAKYEVEYPEWEDKLKTLFEKLAALLEPSSRRATVVFIVDNNGSVPAENAVVEFETFGGIVFEPATWHDKKKDNENLKEISLPVPPKPPNGAWVQKPRVAAFSSTHALAAEFAIAAARNADLSTFMRSVPGQITGYAFPQVPIISGPTNIDRNKFYWKNGKPSKYAAKWTFECAEFRHKVHSEQFNLPLFIRRKDPSDRGAISCTITAKNLPEPVRLVVPVIIEHLQCDTVEEAKTLIQSSGWSFKSV